MQKAVPLYKPAGMTPLACLNLFQEKNPEYKKEKLCYAGRLDPMAEGLLLVLVGDECKKRKAYENLPKTYTYSFILGLSTDTYDLLGVPTKSSYSITPKKSEDELKLLLSRFIGTYKQQYPPYSSKHVKGKPLFYWAKQGKLCEITIPEKEITIYKLTMINLSTITAEKLLKEIKQRIGNIYGDFRQKEIIAAWEKRLAENNDVFSLITCKISCSSGTYVRSLVNTFGQKLAIQAVTHRIVRTSIGRFTVENFLPLDKW